MKNWKPWQLGLALLGLVLGGWLLIVAMGFAILRGLIGFLNLNED